MSNIQKTNIKITRPMIPLTPRFQKVYRQLCSELIDEGSFEVRDYLIIQNLCYTLQLYVQACEKIASIEDCLEYYKNGSNVSGLFTAFNKLQSNLLQLYPQLGIGMKARQRMINVVNQQLNLFDPWEQMTTVDV